jgi:single-strand DNA-binding protein
LLDRLQPDLAALPANRFKVVPPFPSRALGSARQTQPRIGLVLKQPRIPDVRDQMNTQAHNNLNLIGYLASDPALKALPSGTSVCELRVAVRGAGNSREDAGFFDVATFGPAGEAAARYLSKGSRVAVHGVLKHNTWKAEDGTNRSAVRIVGDVQFLDRRTNDDETAAEAIAAATPVDNLPADDDNPF